MTDDLSDSFNFNSEHLKYIVVAIVVLGTLFGIWYYIYKKRNEPIVAKAISSANFPNTYLFTLNNELITPRKVEDFAAPPGTIALWARDGDIPVGWVLCNGQNGTPNLNDKFPLGYDSSRHSTLHATGGSINATLEVKHLPKHTHTIDRYKYRDNNIVDDRVGSENTVNCVDKNDWNTGLVTWDTFDSSGTKTTSTNPTHNNMPPYVVLKFIMKT